MVLDNIRNSAKHLYERFSSPFGGTFITVWAIHHWQLVYSFFTFDDDCTLNDRIYILQQYLSKSDELNLLWLPLLYTFIVMSSYLLLSNLGYAVVLIFEKWAKPLIHFIFDRNKNASREDLDRLKGLLQDTFISLEKAKNSAHIAKEQRDTLEKEQIENKAELSNLRKIQEERTLKIDELSKSLSDTNKSLKNIDDEYWKNQLLMNKLQYKYSQMLEQSNVKPIENAYEILKDDWVLNFRRKNGVKGVELFNIDNNNYYIVDEKNVFKITQMISFENGKYLVFTKESCEESSIFYENRLVKISAGYYVGVESFVGISNDYTYVEYKKATEI